MKSADLFYVLIGQREKIEKFAVVMDAETLIAHVLVEPLTAEIFLVGRQHDAAGMYRFRPLFRGGHQASAEVFALPFFGDANAQPGNFSVLVPEKDNSCNLFAVGRVVNCRPEDVIWQLAPQKCICDLFIAAVSVEEVGALLSQPAEEGVDTLLVFGGEQSDSEVLNNLFHLYVPPVWG